MASLADVLKKYETSYKGNNDRTVKLNPGKTVIRVLPGWRKNDATFFHAFGQHYIKRPAPDANGKSIAAVFVCSAATHGQPCEVCSAIEQGIMGARDPVVLKALNDSKAGRKFLVNVLVRSGQDPNTPVVMELPKTVFDAIMNMVGMYGEAFFDPARGVDLIIDKSGKDLGTKYQVFPSPQSKPYDPSVLSNLPNLDEFVRQEEEARVRALTAVSATAGFVTGGAPAALPPAGQMMPHWAQGTTQSAPGNAGPYLAAAPTAGPVLSKEVAPTPLPTTPVASGSEVVFSNDELAGLLASLGS